MDLSKLSTADLLALRAGQLDRVSNEGLMILKGSTPQQGANDRFRRDTADGAFYRQAGEMALQGMSPVDRFVAGYGKAGVDLARGVGQVFGIVDRKSEDERKARDAALTNSTAGMAGNIAGTVINAAPLALAPGAATIPGAAMAGALTGTLQPVGTDDSRLRNAVVGGLAGAGGQMAGNLIGRAIRPVQSTLNAPQRQLAAKAGQMGISLDAADLTGSRPLKTMRSVMESLPLTADAQRAASEAKKIAFNRAALREVGENADLATPDVLNNARTRIGQQFETLSGRNSVDLGSDFLNTLTKIDASRTSFSSPKIAESIDKALDLASSGKISGAEYQKVRTTLNKAYKDAFNSGNSELGQALKAMRDGLDDAATKSISPTDKAAWQEARAQWQALKLLEKAAAPTSADAVAGNVSPAKLAQALRVADPKGFAYGTRPGDMGDLARVGKAFVQESIQNSGTAERTFWQKVMTEPVSALMQYGSGGLSVPLQKAINSPAGQKYLTNGMANLTQKQLAQIAALTRYTGVALPASANATKQ